MGQRKDVGQRRWVEVGPVDDTAFGEDQALITCTKRIGERRLFSEDSKESRYSWGGGMQR